MAKKKNIYQNLDLKQVKVELQRNVDYLASIDIEGIDDDITENVVGTGGVVPIVEASIEQKLDSFIVLIKDSINQLKHITNMEGEVSAFVETLLIRLKKHMKDFQEYYEKRPPELIVVRNWISYKYNKKTKQQFQMKKLVANIPTQIKSRTKHLNTLLELLPIVAMIEDAKSEEVQLRGGKDVPWMMKNRI